MRANIAQKLASLRVIGAWSRGALIAYIVTAVALMAIGGFQWADSHPTEIVVERPGQAALRNAISSMALAIGSAANLLTMLASMILTSMWVYRANENLRTIGLKGLNYTPAWALGSFFVPIVNLVIPFRAMRELCNRSYGESEYQAYETVPDVSSWWTCFIVGNLVQAMLQFQVAIRLMTPFYFTAPPMAVLLLAHLASVLLMGSAFFLFRIIGAVTKAQLSVTGIEETFS